MSTVANGRRHGARPGAGAAQHLANCTEGGRSGPEEGCQFELPELPQGTAVKVVGLVATPWAMGDRNGVAFRATRVEPERVVLPPAGFTAELLAAAIRDAATTVAVKLPATSRAPVRSVGWGEQLDIRCIGAEADDLKHPSAEAVAAYIAKYATKATEGFRPALDRRLTAHDLDHLDVNEHIAELVRTCWRLGADPSLPPLRLRQWAHMLGFRGHWSTKSRRYSTTFTALRRARVEHATRERLDPWGRPARKRRRSWWGSGATRAGGYRTAADAWLAPRLPPAPANSDGSPRGAGRLMR